MNLPVLIILGIAAVAFIVFLIIRNQKDKNEVVEQIKNDFPKAKAGDEDIDVENKI